MAVEIFLKLEGVEGESQATGHTNEIEVFSFSFGASNPSSVAFGTGSGAGKADLSSISLQKQVDNSSCKLFQNCCAGEHFASGTITVREAGGSTPLEYYVAEMKQVFIDSISWGGASGGGKPSESVALSYESIKITYIPQKADGSKGTKQEGSWDIKKNAAS
jgi:type VI secretion system secreted protein Hcp